jgi:protein SCO1/2
MKLRKAIGVLGLVAVAVMSWRWVDRFKNETPLPDYGEVADFSLQERSGQLFSRKDLRGRVWIANFIFTRCGGPCPRLSKTLAGMQGGFAPADTVGFVSFSVDPGHDTPAVLSAYADRYGAEKGRWFFLTGETQTVHDLILKSFRVAVGEEMHHSLHFVLMDAEAHIRGYYEGTGERSLRQLRADVRRLL